MTQMLGTILVLLALPLVLASHGGSPHAGRVYHTVLVKEIPTTVHTHICTRGVAVLVKKEADGDVHIRIEDSDGSSAFVVGEIIPTLQPKDKTAIRVPKVGDWIQACGIHRYDKAHKWEEIHPIERLK